MEQRTHIGWIDSMRILACLMVVFAHCCDGFVARFDADRDAFLTGVFAGSLARPSVPLFVMMTGVLLLPVRTSLGTFWRRRIGRIARPLVFWSLALPALYAVYLNFVNPATANPLAVPADYPVEGLWRSLYTWVFNFSVPSTPLWYLYLLIGLYLAMPLLGAWLERASKRDMQLVLAVWGLSLFLPYLKMAAPMLGYAGNYGNMGLWGVCDWNESGSLYYLSGFGGYLLLARYLEKYPLRWSRRRTLALCLPLFAAGYAVTALGYIETQRHFPGQYAYLEIVWQFTGINVFLMTFSLYALVRRFAPSNPRARTARLATLTFGIYLAHYALILPAYDLFDIPALPYPARIVLMTAAVFGASAALVWAMRRIAFLRPFVS